MINRKYFVYAETKNGDSAAGFRAIFAHRSFLPDPERVFNHAVDYIKKIRVGRATNRK